MASITIVSGCPGAGKTTLARELACRTEGGLHLLSDTFYRFPARPLDPTTPAAHRQNASIMRALGRAAGSFAEDAYAVFLDGVIGPWFLPVLARELPRDVPLEYVVLQVRLQDALDRVRDREGAGTSAGVTRMHRAFSELGEFGRCALETSQASVEEVIAEFLARRERGEFRVSRESLEG
jgi:cytidylate kinase